MSQQQAETPPSWLRPTPNVTGIGHSLSPDEAEEIATRVLESLSISRVHDLTPLGLLKSPAWAAVTPLATDLTVHLGKGRNHQMARLSAMYEAIERMTAELPLETSKLPLPPADIQPTDSVCQNFKKVYEARQDTYAAWDLINEKWVMIPECLVKNPAKTIDINRSSTNGLASGGTVIEAVLHGLYEIVERDALTEHLACTDFAIEAESSNRIALSSFSNKYINAIEKNIVDNAMDLAVLDIRNHLNIPTVVTYLRDTGVPGFEGDDLIFMGAGSGYNYESAILRSLTEACQSHTGFMLGSREHYEGIGDIDIQTEREEALIRRLKIFVQKPRRVSYSSINIHKLGHQDLLDEIKWLTCHLRDEGIDRVYIVELISAVHDIPVVKVISPQMSSPLGVWPEFISTELLERMAYE